MANDLEIIKGGLNEIWGVEVKFQGRSVHSDMCGINFISSDTPNYWLRSWWPGFKSLQVRQESLHYHLQTGSSACIIVGMGVGGVFPWP
jgi:hypothetical protein